MAQVVKHVANACVNRYVNQYVNPYVITCGLRRGAGQVAGGAAAAAEAEEEPEMFVYEFVGDLAQYDLPDLVSADGEVLEAGWKAAELLRRALAGFRSMSAAERAEVEALLKHVFDPTDTAFAGESFVYRWTRGVWSLSFTHNGHEPRFTRLGVWAMGPQAERPLLVQCLTHKRLPARAELRVLSAGRQVRQGA
jgi:hypothetical protein